MTRTGSGRTARLSRRTFLPGALVAGVGAPLLLAACTPSGQAADPGSGFVQGDGSFVVIPPDKREKAPILSGDDLDGAPLSTADFAGQVIVLNVWGSWCAPCRKEAPDVVAAATTLAGTAEVLGINTRDLTTDPAQAFVRTFEVPYRSFFDPAGKLLLQLAALPPNAIPSTVVLDAEGRVAARVTGATTTATLVGVATDIAQGK